MTRASYHPSILNTQFLYLKLIPLIFLVCYRSAGEFVGTYLQCLDSSNQDVITSALKQLPELILLAQGKVTYRADLFVTSDVTV